jgi:hypothetical protein
VSDHVRSRPLEGVLLGDADFWFSGTGEPPRLIRYCDRCELELPPVYHIHRIGRVDLSGRTERWKELRSEYLCSACHCHRLEHLLREGRARR